MTDDTTHAGAADDVRPTKERDLGELMDGMKQAAKDMLDGNVVSDLDAIRENVRKMREDS